METYPQACRGVGRDEDAEEDHRLIERVAKRDEGAFRELLLKHGPKIHAVLKRRLWGDTDAIEEVFMDTAHRVWAGAQSFEVSRGTLVLSWILAVALNCVNDHLRKAKHLRHETVQLESLPTEIQDTTDVQRRVVVADALDRLPKKYRYVLLQKYIGGYSVKEIAEHLSTTPKGAESLLRHARERLAKELRD